MFHKTTRFSGADSGMTLIEVVIASFLVVMITVALYSTLSFAQRSLTVHEHRMTSLHLARQQLEFLRTKTYIDLRVANYKMGGLPQPFSGCYTITEPKKDQLKHISLAIEWQERWGASFKTELETQMSQALHP